MPARTKDYFEELRRGAKKDMATQLWLEYYIDTEEYDRRVCSGPMGLDGILPRTKREATLIAHNAHECLSRLIGDAHSYEIGSEELRAGRQRVVGMQLESMKELLAKLRRGD